jgi:biopolymer transport protein ExbD
MKTLFSFILSVLLMTSVIQVEAQTRDTLTVSQNASTKVITIQSQKSGALKVNPYDYAGRNNVIASYSTAGADTMIIVTRVSDNVVITRYRKTQFTLRTYGITQVGADFLNAYFNPPNLAQRNATTAQRDSLFNWGFTPVGTIIFNTSIDSPQIRVASTINWRTF